MNFMDLYLDAQKYHEKIDEPEKDINHNEIYRQYCECSLAIYEANNFIDLHYIKERHTLYAEVSTYVKAIGAFIVGAILLLMKIVIGLKAAILGAGLLFIMWLLKKLKGAFKKDNIDTAGGGGGGGSSSSSSSTANITVERVQAAEDKSLRRKILNEAKKYKTKNITEFIRGVDGYDKFSDMIIKDCIKISKKTSVRWDIKEWDKPPKEYLEMIESAISFGIDDRNIGAFATKEKYGDFLSKCLEKCITSGVSLRGNSYKDFISKQPFYRIKYDDKLRKSTFSDAKTKSIGEFSGDVILNCDSFIAMSLITQLAMMQFLDGENSSTNYNELYKSVTENLPSRAKGSVSELSTRYKSMFIDNSDTNNEAKLMQVLDGCKFKLKSIDAYNNMSKFYASLKNEQVSNPTLKVVKNKKLIGVPVYDIVFDDIEEKYTWIEILTYTQNAIGNYDDGYSPERLKKSINALTENGKKLKDTFDKIDMSKQTDELKKHQAFIKKVQEFSINILTIVNQSIMLGPAAINNTQSKVYEELMYDLGIITYNVVADSAFNAFMQSDNTIDI
jgi:hypothetical protein|nr:MAG TPA: hypothetical protein [Caudoviricetes sp.]